MSKEKECPMCHKVGFHKLSCPTQKVTIWYDNDSFIKTEMAIDNEMRKRFIDKAKELQERYDNDYLKMQELISKEAKVVTEEDLERMNKYIPTLEGDEAEEFIRKADEALKDEKTDWTLQSKRAERILEKSRIANRKLRYTKSDTPNVKRSKDVEE